MSRPTERGFSFLEMLSVVALVGLVAMATGPLLEQSSRIIEGAGAATRQASPQVIGALLRADLEAGEVLPDAASPTALALRMPGGGSVLWELAGTRLVRLTRDAAGAPTGRPLVLPGARSWSWQQVSGELVEVRLVWREVALGPPPAVPDSARATPGQRTAVWRVARRGGQGGHSW